MLITKLTTCPECQADLRELAPPASCPGCGFAFDVETCVWRSSRSWQHAYVVYGLMGLVTGLAVAGVERLSAGEVSNALLPIVAGLSVAVLGLLLHRVLTGKLSGRFVAVTPAGIVVGLRRPARLIPWSDYRRLVTRGRVPSIECHATPVPVALEDVFENDEELTAFAAALRRAGERRTP
ncbi:MAG: hypothetical protein PVJ57_22795 [Phycisphaerae bacterium]|jgi:hypothetical protein